MSDAVLPWFLAAVALDDPEWAEAAQRQWDAVASGRADDMLDALLADMQLGHEFWAFVVPHFQDAYLADHPGVDAAEYEFAFHASAGHQRYRQWLHSPTTK